MFSAMMAIMTDADNYEDRKVAKTRKRNGITVSTAYSSDCGYETALFDENGIHPVERYKDRDEAEVGHRKWVRNAKPNMTVTKLGDADGWVEDEDVVLQCNNDVELLCLI